MFVVVSIYADPGKKTIIHTYGPKDTRSSAVALQKKMREDDTILHGYSSPHLMLTVCKVLGPDVEDIDAQAD